MVTHILHFNVTLMRVILKMVLNFKHKVVSNLPIQSGEQIWYWQVNSARTSLTEHFSVFCNSFQLIFDVAYTLIPTALYLERHCKLTTHLIDLFHKFPLFWRTLLMCSGHIDKNTWNNKTKWFIIPYHEINNFNQNHWRVLFNCSLHLLCNESCSCLTC